MRKYLLSGLIGIILLVILACGSDPTAVPAATTAPPAATTAPVATTAPATTAPAATTVPAATTAPAADAVSPELLAYAAEHAGGPGAIYVGDLSQLVGPAITKDQGDLDGNVPLGSLQEHLFIYESDYYKSLLEKANLTNPTELVSTNLDIKIQSVCINRALLFCKLSDTYTHPNVLERTNGQLTMESVSFPELGIAGPDSLALVEDGTLDLATMVPAYIGGELPGMDIIYMWNLYPDRETQFNVFFALIPDIERILEEETGGGKVIFRSWGSGIDVYLWSKKALNTPEDYEGLKIRTPGTAFSDFAEGMGADAQFIAFSEVYTGLERGILDGAISGANAGFGQRWYEVTDYITGPLLNMEAFNVIMSKKVWEELPPDLQQILIEEGAKDELEALRLVGVQNDMGLLVNTNAGSEFVEFSPEVTAAVNAATMDRVVPNWVKRVGGGDQPIIKIFNEKVGPRIGIRVELDGTVVEAPITISD